MLHKFITVVLTIYCAVMSYVVYYQNEFLLALVDRHIELTQTVTKTIKALNELEPPTHKKVKK